MGPSDSELIAASRRGERAAFGHLVERYQDLVWTVSFSSTGDAALSEDVTQETFIAAWRRLAQLRDAFGLKSWLCTIARNLARKAKKRTDREQAIDDDVPAAGNPFDDAAHAEVERIVRDALARVPELYREALVLYYREHDSVRDVAAALGISETSVQQRLSRGRKYLAAGVTDLVERALRGSLRKNVVAGVLAAIALGTGSRVDASTSKGSTMFKLALAGTLLTAAGTTAYVTAQHHAAKPSTAAGSADEPMAVAARPTVPPATPTPSPGLPATRPAVSPPGSSGSDVSTFVSSDQIKKLHLDQGPSHGPADAPVTIVVFQDNQCTYCGHALATVDQLMDEFPGKLRIVMKQFPVHQTARLSAEALYAADAQGRFWELHDLIFQHQDDLSRDALIGYARDVGLNVETFTEALDHHTYANAVAADVAAGREIGISGTPSFLINDREIVGALPIENFRAAVNAALQD